MAVVIQTMVIVTTMVVEVVIAVPAVDVKVSHPLLGSLGNIRNVDEVIGHVEVVLEPVTEGGSGLRGLYGVLHSVALLGGVDSIGYFAPKSITESTP